MLYSPFHKSPKECTHLSLSLFAMAQKINCSVIICVCSLRVRASPSLAKGSLYSSFFSSCNPRRKKKASCPIPERTSACNISVPFRNLKIFCLPGACWPEFSLGTWGCCKGKLRKLLWTGSLEPGVYKSRQEVTFGGHGLD